MDDRATFINTIYPLAQDEESRSGIHPLITITQAAHESNWGNSGLTRKANNLFGFTGDSWAAEGKPVIKLPTSEFVHDQWITIERPFRAYGSWSESIRDWASLMQRPRYVKALDAAKRGDIVDFATEVATAGYATDPKYAEALISVAKFVQSIKPDLWEAA
jgi:flagellum-specific peptidoglycan hydrolase FlgJ